MQRMRRVLFLRRRDGRDPGLPPVPMRRENVCAGNATQALLWGSYKQEAASSGSHPI